MKLNLALILILIAPLAHAGNYVAESELGQDGAKVYPDASGGRCQAQKSEPCFDITGKPTDEYSIQSVQVDDTSSPIYSVPSLEEDCADAAACVAQVGPADYCPDPAELKFWGDRDQDGDFETWCTTVTGFNQINVDRLLPDSAKQAAKAAAAAEAAAVAVVQARKAFGENLSARMAVRNAAKSLTTAQKKSVRVTLADLIGALDQGDIEGAREEMVAITPDGAEITQTDKDWGIAEIDAYLASE